MSHGEKRRSLVEHPTIQCRIRKTQAYPVRKRYVTLSSIPGVLNLCRSDARTLSLKNFRHEKVLEEELRSIYVAQYIGLDT